MQYQNVGTGVLIVDAFGNAIVNKKDDSHNYPYPDTLSLFGGGLEPYELAAEHLSPAQQAHLALRRELYEELLHPQLVDEIVPRLVAFDKLELPGKTTGQPLTYWPFLCLVDTETFGRWYDILFLDGEARQGVPRQGVIRPREGAQHYVPGTQWAALLPRKDQFLGDLDQAFTTLLRCVPHLQLEPR